MFSYTTACLLSFLIAAVSATSDTGRVVHYNSEYVRPLSEICADPAVGTVILHSISYVSSSWMRLDTDTCSLSFSENRWSGSCDSTWETNIKTCQANGKTVCLSVDKMDLVNEADPVLISNTLLRSFGALSDVSFSTRPFGDAVIDGFDFGSPDTLETSSKGPLTEEQILRLTTPNGNVYPISTFEGIAPHIPPSSRSILACIVATLALLL